MFNFTKIFIGHHCSNIFSQIILTLPLYYCLEFSLIIYFLAFLLLSSILCPFLCSSGIVSEGPFPVALFLWQNSCISDPYVSMFYTTVLGIIILLSFVMFLLHKVLFIRRPTTLENSIQLTIFSPLFHVSLLFLMILFQYPNLG